jgi:hypothetical protein
MVDAAFRAQAHLQILHINSVHVAATRAQRRRLPSGVRPDAGTRPDFRLFPIALHIVFSIARRCSWHRGFSLAVARPCIVIDAHFPLQIDCILPGTPHPEVLGA